MVCVWADLVLGWEIECRLHDCPQLFSFDDMWGWPWSPASAEDAARRNLMPLIFGMSVKAKTTDHIESDPRCVLGCRRAAPLIESINGDVLIAKGFGVLREKPKHAVLLGKFAPQVTMEGDVA